MSVPRSLDLAPTVTSTRVAVASGELAALVATPPDGVTRRAGVLAVPGYTGSKEDFVHLLPLLADAGHRVTAIDLRGQYESGGPEDVEAYTMQALAADVASLLRDGEPQHVIGHSFGGLICREAVLGGAPALSLTLLSSGPGALGGKRGGLVELMRPVLEDSGVPGLWEVSQALEADDPAKAAQPQPVKDFLKARFLASPAAAYVGMGTTVTTAPDRVAELRATGVPVLVAYGSLDDAWTPESQQDMAERLGAQQVVFDGLGHSPAVQDEATVAAALEAFWVSLSE